MLKAFILINTEIGFENEVLSYLRKVKGVEEVYMLYGIYDIIAEVKAENVEDIWAIIIKIRKMQNILSTVTLQVVS